MCTHPLESSFIRVWRRNGGGGVIKWQRGAVSMRESLKIVGLRSSLNGDLRSVLNLPANETLV